ncbi:MAG TPA: hypothetical protein VFP88_06460, partial [Rhodanobacteraceae bacterium]|nr:hypothetical protein [Rhodanobacteraceae bacterium]
APDALATLVNRRLLRIEERLDLRRVELTHDVLCSVVLASRNLRQARELSEAAERQLTAQREREAATHRALLRARTIATVCAVLMLLAIAGAIFGFVNMRRARTAQIEAQNSRSNAEKLVSFLIEDFYSELQPTGRLETLGKLAHMTVGYYDGLPPELVTPQTRIYRAMALVREGAALQSSGNIDAAYRSFGDAQSVFEKLRASGDRSESVTYGLALTLESQGSSIVGGGNGRGTMAQLIQASDLLRPLVYGSAPSRRVRQLYADTLNYLSHAQSPQAGVASCEEGRKVLAGLGALELSDLNATSSYADITDSEAREVLVLGQVAKSRALEQQVYDLAEKVLAQRPGDLHALSDRSWAAELIGTLADRQHDDATAAEYADRTVQAGEDEVRFNPSDLGAWQRWSVGLEEVADRQLERGDVTKAIATMRSLLALEQDKRLPSSLGRTVWYEWIQLAHLQAQTGDSAGATQSLAYFARDVGELLAPLAADDVRRKLLANLGGIKAGLQLDEGQAQAALATAAATIADIDPVTVQPHSTGYLLKRNMLGGNLLIASAAAIRLGRYAQAEALARRWLAVPADPTSEADPQITSSRARVYLAHAIALQSRTGEAQKILQPALDFYRREQQAGARGTTFRHDYAYALYVSAIAASTDATGQAQRKKALAEAATLIAGASAEAQRMADMRQVSGLIASAGASPHL